MQSGKDQARKSQLAENKIKQDILAELDSFLLEANETRVSNMGIDQARVKALQELDRLIKQDLSAGEILQRLKSKSQAIKPDKSPSSPSDKFYSSIHVVDLRSDYEPSSGEKKDLLHRLFPQKTADVNNDLTESLPSEAGEAIAETPSAIEAEPDIRPEAVIKPPAVLLEPEPLVFEPSPTAQTEPDKQNLQPAKKNQNTAYGLALKKTALISAIALVILLPVQGFVFVGKLQQDKNKLLNYGQSGFLAFKSGVLKASSNSYQEADIDFANALNDFSQAKDILNKYDAQFLNLADKLPLIGDTLKSGDNILSITSSLSQAARIVNRQRESASDLTDYIAVLDQQLEELVPLLEDTNKRLDNLVGVPESIDGLDLNLVKNELPPLILNLKKLKTITSTLESLLGSDEEQRYLLLFQNNNEIRATGGFIGSYALLDVNKGKIAQMEIPKGGTYDLTAGQKKQWRSPQALSIVNTTFNIWDANWWPDFPTSAKKISKLFAESSGSSVDGVIAVNATVLQKLLAITGPLDLPEYNVQINADNVVDVLQAEIEGKRNESNPKTIISDLAPQVLAKILATDNQAEEMFALLATILQNKDLQIYSTDQNIDKQISNLGWRGEMMATDRDYLMVLSTNIAGGKTDLAINELIEHQAVISANGEIINTVKLTRSNEGSLDNVFLGLDGANVSYLRFFVPLGSQLISATGFDTIAEHYFANNRQYDVDPDLLSEESKLVDNESKTEIFESLERTVFANWQTLKAGETKTVSISYKLPLTLDLGSQLTNDWQRIFLGNKRHFDHYSLLVQSQSGQQQALINSQIILPKNSKIIWQAANDENNVQVQDNQANYNQNLDSDQYFGVVMTTQ